MKRHIAFLLLFLSLAFAAAAQTLSGLKGVVTDPSGSLVPETLVQIVGPGGEHRAATDTNGQYSFANLPAGKYTVRFIAKGFSVGVKQEVEISGLLTLDYQLNVQANAQVINVDEEANSISVDPAQNADALVVSENQVAGLSDDPAILQQQLLALAGPAGGPNGGQIYVDGFSGAQLPPKASIQEIRINSNPYSPEFDSPGSSIIQIITKPGTNTLHGNASYLYNKEALNSRSPLLTQSKRPPLKQEQAFITFSGKLKKSKASWSLNASKNDLTQNAFIYATTLDSNLNPLQINQTVLTPRGNWNWQPRIDYMINTNNTLGISFFNGHNRVHNQGVGDFGLASRAYDNHGNNNQVQASETAILSARMVSDTRFQYFRSLSYNTGDIGTPGIIVPGAFSGGGGQVGNSGSVTTSLELNSSTSFAYKTHTLRWGGRLRDAILHNVSENNFGGTFSFQGGQGPALDASNNPLPGTIMDLSALDVYRRTLLFQKLGLSDAAIRQRGGGAYQFSISAGQRILDLSQFDLGFFFADDWRARPNLTVSYGIRYEAQTNISDDHDWAPRVAVAWNVDSKAGKPGKTVLRAGVGLFYSRIGIFTKQNELRFNGTTQQSFVVFSPSFFPAIPSISTLTSGLQPQQVQLTDSRIEAPQNFQASLGADRQLSKTARLSVNYSQSRGVHLQRTRDINAPFPGTFTVPGTGVFPFGDSQIRMLTESTGFSRTQQLTVTPTLNLKAVFLAGYYTLSFGKSDAEGSPSNPYNLRADWGPSTWGDTRHRVVFISNFTLPKKVTLSVNFQASSGAPYNIVAGRDLNGDNINTERPSLVTGAAAASCSGATLIYKPEFGCFNLSPAAGTAISRNFARGPSQVNVSYVSLGRSWIFGAKEGPKGGMVNVPGPNGTTIQVPAALAGMAAPTATRTYNLALSVNAQNPLNHTIYNAPSGDLSSPFFGAYRSTAYGSTWNRQVTMQLRLVF